jgi:hypothetical protein
MGNMGILERWRFYRDRKKGERERSEALAELIEQMVKDSDPSIRKVAGYRQQLQSPVEKALEYIDNLIAAIPGPLGLSAELWDKDPLVHALFVNPDEIRSLLQNCADLKAFFQHSGMDTAVALLTAAKKERTIFGTALEGDMILRDVPQVAVEFYDHRVVASVATEEEIRRELFHLGLNVLSTYALEEMTKSQIIKEELSEQRRILAAQLKIHHARNRGLESLLAGGGQSKKDAEEALQLLAEIDKQLMALEPGSGTPEDFLRKLKDVLNEPGNILTEKTIEMRLNLMGIKVDEASTENGHGITLTELEMPGRISRVAVLANISVNECLSP